MTRRGIVRLASLALVGAALALPSAAQADSRVLVVTSTQDELTSAGVAAIKAAGESGGFSVTAPAPADLGAEFANLGQYNAVVFLATGPSSPLTDEQRDAFESYFRNGGGFVGIGSAIETDPSWQFLTDVLGTRATGKTDVQPGTVKVADRGHDASKNLPEYWTRTDAWYNFESNVRNRSHVLATVVERVDEIGSFEFQPWGGRLTGITGGTMGFDHPVAWCKDYRGGRSFYTSFGNTPEAFGNAELRSHLAGAIRWAAGESDPAYSDCGATVLSNYKQTKVGAQPNLSEPVGFDVLPDGRVIQTDRRGGVRLHTRVGDSTQTTLLAQIPDLYTASEDGLYGPAIDPNFEQNKWVYLYYSPAVVEDVKLSTGEIVTQRTPTANAPNTGASPEVWDPWVGYFQLSRFKFVEATEDTPAHLDLDSEEQIMRVPVNRGACCHVAGDIDFDKHGNLWLVTGDDTPAGGGNSGGFGPFNDMLTTAGLLNAPHVDARRSSLNTNDLRGKLLRIKVKDGPISEEEENKFGGAYTVPAGNLFPVGQEHTRPEIYAMGFRNPFRVQVDENDVAYVTDYSPDSQNPAVNRGPAGTGRVEIVRQPANYGWPVCYRTDLAYYRWNFNTSQPLDDPPMKHDCTRPDRGPDNDSRWNVEGGPSVEPGLVQTPPITNPDVWYSYTPENRANNPIGTPCSAHYDGNVPAEERVCPRLFPEFGTGGVGPHGAAKYRYDASDPDTTKLPPYFDGAVFFGEFTRDWLREIRLDSQNRVFKINNLLSCGGVGTGAANEFGFECDNPMDMQFDGHGHFWLLTYGDGFFNINNDAGLYRWDYVRGPASPTIQNATATPLPGGHGGLTVRLSAQASDPDPGDSLRFEWDFGDGSPTSNAPSPTHTYTQRGTYTATVTVTDPSGNSTQATVPVVVNNIDETTVGGTVPATLALTLGGPAQFGAFIPGVAATYEASTTATVTSTAADALLTVADPSSTATGHLVNGEFSLPQPLMVRGSGPLFAPVSGSANPTPLITYTDPVSNNTSTIEFQQQIGATDPLRTGTYSKTLTFTLSTTEP
jgi:cytochrome c